MVAVAFDYCYDFLKAEKNSVLFPRGIYLPLFDVIKCDILLDSFPLSFYLILLFKYFTMPLFILQ